MWLAADPRGPGDDFWYQPVGMNTAAGMRVSPEQAMRLTIVYACVRVLAETVAQLPVILYRRLDRGKERAVEHPLYWLLARRPNSMQTSFEWREMMQGHLALRGNAYSEIVYQGIRIAGLKPHHPDLVRVQEMSTGWRYMIKDTPTSDERPVLRDEMLHLRGLTDRGVTGLNPIEQEREAIGFALAAQDHGARFYRNGAIFPGWIEHPVNFKDKEAREQFRAAWQASQTGGNRFKTPVLEYGMKYHEIPIKHTDAQYLETRKHQNEDVARIFRMPPHKVGILDRSTNNNIEHQGIEFVTDTMMPWLVRWEQRLSESLLTEAEQQEYFFEFLVDGQLRGDAEARSAYYNKGIQDGWLTRNEVRELENRNPLSGLDEPLEPLNMTRAGEPESTRRDRQRQRERDGDRAAALQLAAAERVVRKEQLALGKAYDRLLPDAEAFLAAVDDFYRGHIAYVTDTTLASRETAARYCLENREEIHAAADRERTQTGSGVKQALDSLSFNRAQELATMIAQEIDR